MASRFGLVQTASVIGVGVGGVITNQFGPTAAYGLLGVGLVILAMYAIAAGRSTINPLHGAAYEARTLAKGATASEQHDDGAMHGAVNGQTDGETKTSEPGLHQAKT